ncbi:HEPN domain-containing protein [Mycolicibacterium sp. lyk4-40-TYG-92]|uniref:ApeA N-terminal domain 1-containing protein n=1 Tax=Mycolicibacterium sp. lyk4-40-TYG-92 TaxID=3040295 RepID=UPI00254D584F|nr:HEPN domain-containing protein [Mycolicibacterium sp. lyk4-40-TYG-92]
MRQSEPQRIKGWFYLPESPADRVPGILSWQPDGGATLELIGGFSPGPEYHRTSTGGLRASQLIGDVRQGTIYGESDTGEAISVWDAQRGRYTAGLAGVVRDEFWHSSWICVGAHIASPHEPVLAKAVVMADELYYLTEDPRFCPPQWARSDDVEHPGELQPDGTLLTPYVFPVIGGYRAEYAQGDTTDASYSIATTATRPWASPATEAYPDLKLHMMTADLRGGSVIKLHVGAQAVIRLPDNASGSAVAFFDRMTAVDDLVQLATFEPCGIAQVTMTTTDDTQVSLLVHAGEVARPDDAHKPASVVFTLADVPLDAYLHVRERLADGYQASYAWSVVVGLCGYSSRIVEEYVSQAFAGAEGFHHWCLSGGNNMHLKDRLKALHNKLDPKVQALLGLNINHWLSWAVWARNHVAHGGTNKWRPLQDNFQLHAVAESVHLVSYLALLQELGVPVEKTCDALRNHPRLQVTAQRCSEVNDLASEPPPDAAL